MTDQPNDAPAKTPVEAAVETFIYAPIGLLFEGASLLPQLIEKGKNQVNMARMIGKFAVGQAGGEATKAAGRLQDQAAGVLDFIGGGITPGEPPLEPSAPARAPKPSVPRPNAGAARDAARKVAGAVSTTVSSAASATVAAAVDAATLAIPDYDGLSASHVVNRLAGLSPVELESVRLYELANRGRKTILSKVAQLQSS